MNTLSTFLSASARQLKSAFPSSSSFDSITSIIGDAFNAFLIFVWHFSTK
ncbi:hypothetical protein Plhal703r1_c30g0119841 [Plasmopara halstedii]